MSPVIKISDHQQVGSTFFFFIIFCFWTEHQDSIRLVILKIRAKSMKTTKFVVLPPQRGKCANPETTMARGGERELEKGRRWKLSQGNGRIPNQQMSLPPKRNQTTTEQKSFILLESFDAHLVVHVGTTGVGHPIRSKTRKGPRNLEYEKFIFFLYTAPLQEILFLHCMPPRKCRF